MVSLSDGRFPTKWDIYQVENWDRIQVCAKAFGKLGNCSQGSGMYRIAIRKGLRKFLELRPKSYERKIWGV